MIRTTLLVLIPLSATIWAQEGQPGGKDILGGMLPMMLIMFAIIYFLMIRPEQKKQKTRQAMLSAVKKGDKVVTAGGIYGTVGQVKDQSIMVKVADNVVMEFTKSSISNVLNKDGTEKETKPAEKKS